MSPMRFAGIRRLVRKSLLIACMCASASATAFIDSPVLVPSNPIAGDVVSVSIRSGVCDGFVAGPPSITQAGNSIHMLLETIHYDDPLFCFVSPFTSTFEVGTFPAGTYTLEVERFYDTAVPDPVYEVLANFAFTVGAAAPTTALPSLGIVGGLVLVVGVLVLVVVKRRRMGPLVMWCFAMLLVSTHVNVRAQDSFSVEALLSGQPGAPTPEDVVFWVDGSTGGDPPLAAFRVVPPEGVSFVLPRRAPPELTAWINKHPDSARAKLERYLIIKYSGDVDVEVALQSLRTDANIENAYISPPVEFSSVALSEFSVPGEIHLGPLVNDYQWTSLNLSAAWFRATGYALVGITDTGLYENHAALRQFSGTGQYIGGNFIPAASLDVGSGSTSDYNVDEQEPEPITDPACNPSGLPGIPISVAGHGTHVSGLVGANVNSGLDLKGSCKHCGIAMARIVKGSCLTTGQLVPKFTFASVASGITWLTAQ